MKPLTEKFLKFWYKAIHADNVLFIVFMPSFVQIHKAEVTKPMRGIHDKNNGFPTLSPWSLERSR